MRASIGSSWLGEAEIVPPGRLVDLTNEFGEILAMTVASLRTLRGLNSANLKSKI